MEKHALGGLELKMDVPPVPPKCTYLAEKLSK
jgi:hypothetical protein